MYTTSDIPVGMTKDAGWEIGVRRTVELTPGEAWQLVTSPAGRRCWLGEVEGWALEPGAAYHLPEGTHGEIRVVSASHLRITWQPPGWERPSTIQVRVNANGPRAVIAFHQEHLPGQAERAERKAHFLAALAALESLAQHLPE